MEINSTQKRQPINLFSDKPNLRECKIDPLISITSPVKREQPINLFTPISNLKNENIKINPLLSMTKPNIKQDQPTVNLFIPIPNLKNRDIDLLIPTLKLNTKDVQTNSSSQIQESVDQPTIREHNINSKNTLCHPQLLTRIDIRRIRGYIR